MATFTFAQLRTLWLQAGGSVGGADIAAAIALAESSGCQYALAGPKDVRPVKQCTYRQTTGENSAGLWQINHNAHPETDLQSLFDPAYNAAAAVRISQNGKDFRPWTTFTTGAYLTYLRQAGGAIPSRPQPQPKTKLPEIGAEGGAQLKPTGVFASWARLMYALGGALPSQAKRTEQATRNLRWLSARGVRSRIP